MRDQYAVSMRGRETHAGLRGLSGEKDVPLCVHTRHVRPRLHPRINNKGIIKTRTV